MKEKIDKLYNEYLSERLGLIFEFGEIIQEELKIPNFTKKIWENQEVEYCNGYAIVEKNRKFNYIDQDGDLISETWYDEAFNFSDGYALVRDDAKSEWSNNYNFINKDGQLIGEKWFYHADSFVGGFAKVEEINDHSATSTYNVIDINGNFVFPTILERKYINRIGILLDKVYFGGIVFKKLPFLDAGDWKTIEYPIYNTDSFSTVCNPKGHAIHIVYKNIDLKDYQVHKTPTGYKIRNSSDTIILKYRPLKVFNSNFVLCHKNNDLYLYNRKNNKYDLIGDTRYISYDDNFIFDEEHGTILFVYGEKVFDIADYYNKHLRGKKIKIKKEDISIISKNEFFIHNEDEIRELVKKEKAEDERRKREEIQLAEKRKLQQIKNTAIQSERKKELEKIEALRQLKKSLTILEEYEEKTGVKERVKISDLFISIGEHKEINPVYLDNKILRHIDMNMESFKNVKIAGIDFRGCNIDLNPQEVYQKDLSNCNFEGIHIAPFVDFSGVNICGARFSRDNDTKTVDYGSATFKNAIYDENTTYNGIPFTIIYGECKNSSSRMMK